MRTLFLAAAAMALVAAGSAQGVVVYDTNTPAAVDGSFSTATPGFAQAVTLGVADAPVTILSFPVFGVRWNSVATTNQQLRISIFTGADETVGAVDALATATLAGQITYGLTPQAVGSYNYTLPGVNITVPGNHIFIVAQFLNTAGTAYSTNLGARLNTGAASPGSNDGFWYVDNGDAVFTGAERNRVIGISNNPAPTEVRMTIDVPAPASAALLGLGGLVAARRRRN